MSQDNLECVPLLSTDLVSHTAREQFLVSPPEETRLWVKNAKGSFDRLCNTPVTVLGATLKSGQVRVGSAFLFPSNAHTGGGESLVPTNPSQMPFPFFFLFLLLVVIMETRSKDGTWPGKQPRAV